MMTNEIAILSVDEVKQIAAPMAKSGLFGFKTPEEAFSLMMIAQAEGLHPAMAARDYHVIQGKPALKADAMLSRFHRAGGTHKLHKYTDDEVVIEFTHAQGGSVTISWTYEMATNAGLTSNPTWKKYRRAMLRSRCISEGIRTVYPGVISGFYTYEEVENSNSKPSKNERVIDIKAEVVKEEAVEIEEEIPQKNTAEEAIYEKLKELATQIKAKKVKHASALGLLLDIKQEAELGGVKIDPKWLNAAEKAIDELRESETVNN